MSTRFISEELANHSPEVVKKIKILLRVVRMIVTPVMFVVTFLLTEVFFLDSNFFRVPFLFLLGYFTGWVCAILRVCEMQCEDEIKYR